MNKRVTTPSLLLSSQTTLLPRVFIWFSHVVVKEDPGDKLSLKRSLRLRYRPHICLSLNKILWPSTLTPPSPSGFRSSPPGIRSMKSYSMSNLGLRQTTTWSFCATTPTSDFQQTTVSEKNESPPVRKGRLFRKLINLLRVVLIFSMNRNEIQVVKVNLE